MRASPWVLLTAAAIGAAAGAARAQDEPTQLDPITVTRPANPLDDSRNKLRRMLETAPDGGAAVPFTEDWTAVVARAFVPPNPSFEQRLESRIVNDWRFYEYGPEMEAFR